MNHKCKLCILVQTTALKCNYPCPAEPWVILFKSIVVPDELTSKKLADLDPLLPLNANYLSTG